MVGGRSVWVATWPLATGGVYSVPLRRTVASAGDSTMSVR